MKFKAVIVLLCLLAQHGMAKKPLKLTYFQIWLKDILVGTKCRAYPRLYYSNSDPYHVEAWEDGVKTLKYGGDDTGFVSCMTKLQHQRVLPGAHYAIEMHSGGLSSTWTKNYYLNAFESEPGSYVHEYDKMKVAYHLSEK